MSEDWNDKRCLTCDVDVGPDIEEVGDVIHGIFQTHKGCGELVGYPTKHGEKVLAAIHAEKVDKP